MCDVNGGKGGVTSSGGRLLPSVQMSALRERSKIMREGPEREDRQQESHSDVLADLTSDNVVLLRGVAALWV